MLATLIHRPYVFMFLAAFLVLGRIYWGWKKTLLWLIIGYVVAWTSEFSSIHNGFPYGLYHYIYENMQGELMVFGVPFWDSLSYPFLIFAGYTTARFIIGIQNPPSPPFTKGGLGGIYIALFGAFLTMLLDVIIDPLTVLGDRWFLGRVYYYPESGWYFGVPLSNFAGWFLVPLVVILVFQMLTKPNLVNSVNPHTLTGVASPVSRFARFPDHSSTASRPWHSGVGVNSVNLKTFLNPIFYLSIVLFNIAITMMIGETLLASIDCFILTPIVGLLIWRIKSFSR